MGNVLKNEVDNLKDDLSGLKNISVDIKNTQSEHNQSTLKELADLLEKIDNETAKLNELKHHVSDLDDYVTALSPDINKNADKIQELDAFKLKLEPLSTSLTQDIASLRGDGKLAEDKLKDLKDYSQKLQDAITAIQENEKHTEKDLAGVKDDSETLAEKLEDLQDKLNQLDVSSTEFKTFNSSVDEKLIVFESKLTGLESANQTNMADLINIKEQNFVQQEKVKFVEALSAKVDTMDDERKKAEALQVEINEDMISKNATAIKDLQVTYDHRLTSLEKEILFFDEYKSDQKTKLEPIESLLNKLGSDMTSITQKHSDIFAELKIINQDMIAVFKNEKDMKMSSNFINSSQEIFNTLTIGNAQHDERIKSLEGFLQLLDNKLGSLESADLFLQEAHRMLTDKTTHVENESRKLEGNVKSILREHKEDFEMVLKKQITMLLKDIEDLNSGIARTDDAIERLDNQSEDFESKVNHFEGTISKHLEESKLSFQLLLKEFEDNNCDKVKRLQDGIHANKEDIEALKSNADSLNDTFMRNEQNVESIKRENNQRLDAISHDLKEKISLNVGVIDGLRTEADIKNSQYNDQLEEVSNYVKSIDLYVKENLDIDKKLQELKDTVSYRFDDVQKEIETKISDEVFSQNNKISNNEKFITDILQKIVSFEENTKLQAKKIHMIEMLSDRLDQLDDKRSKDEQRITGITNSIREDYLKELTEIEQKITSLQKIEITKLSEAADGTRKDLSDIRGDISRITKAFESCTKEQANDSSRLEGNCKILEERLEAAKLALSEILIKLSNLEDEEKYNKEKLISLEDAFHIQGSKAIQVESMVSRMEEVRQQSYAESKEEMKSTAQSNAKAIEQLQKVVEERVTNLYNQMSSELTDLQHSQRQLTLNMEDTQQKSLDVGGEQQ